MILLCAAASAGPFEAPGQGPSAARFGFVRWDVADGLPQGSVTDLAQATDGELVIGTFGGLARFDGARFVSVDEGLPSPRVTAVSRGAGDEVWVGTQYGAVQALGAAAVRLPEAGVIWDLLASDGQAWAATEGGVFRRDGATWTRLPLPGPIHELDAAADRLWVAGPAGFAVIGSDGVHPVAVPIGGVPLAVAADADGAWVATTEGLARVGAGERVVAEWTATRGELLRDAADRLWASADGELRLLGRSRELVEGGEPDPTRWSVAEWVRALYVDRDGSVWVGTDGQGLVRVREREFATYGREAGLAESSVHVLDPTGPEVLAATGCGPAMALRGERFAPTAIGGDGCISAMMRDPAGGVWVADGGRLLPPHGRPIELPRRILSLARDRNGTVWIGTEGAGAWTWNGTHLAPTQVRDTVVAALAVAADGAVWVGGDPRVTVLREGNPTTPAGLPDAQVRAILLDPDGTAWLGTYGGGLVRLENGHATRYTLAEGLPENVVSIVVDDLRGNLWMNGNRGVFRVSRAELDAVADGSAARVRAVAYDTGEGNGGNLPVGGRDPAGRLWFATLRGAVVFDPATLPEATLGPPPRIEGLDVDGRHVTASFTAPMLADTAGLRFEYRLLPVLTEWRDAGASRQVDFPNLEPGTYTFEVRSARGDGAWSPDPGRAEFTLPARLTETVAFRVLSALLIATVAGGAVAYRWRVERAHTADVRQREAHYRRVFEGATNALLVVADGKVVQANPAATRVFGRDPTGSAVDLLLADGEGIRPSGRFPAQITTSALGDRSLVSVVDVGPELEVRARLDQAERLEAIGRLAGGVAHDFNNLLMIVQGNAAELNERLRNDPDAREAVSEISRAADRGADLTRQLLLFGRKQLLRPQTFDAGSRLRDLHPMLRRLLRADVVLSVEVAPAWMHADPTQLELAIVNLVLNAVEALPGGGHIGVAVRSIAGADAAAVWPSVDPSRGWAWLSVSDDGTGIAPEVLPRIFEPFFTTRTDRGTGLGLAGVHGFAAQSAGHVFVRSTLGEGTTFDLLLPSAEPMTEAAARKPSSRPPARGNVVVCDDDPLVLRTLQRLLQSGGYRAVAAATGEEALGALDRENADVLVTDVLMPGMNGVELARRARERRPRLRVVFASGYTRDLLPQPIDGILLGKPFTREALLAAVAGEARPTLPP